MPRPDVYKRQAHKGFEDSSRIAHRLATPSVEKRISLAVEIGKKGADWESAMLELRNIIGAGLMATEAIPCVFGILICRARLQGNIHAAAFYRLEYSLFICFKRKEIVVT